MGDYDGNDVRGWAMGGVPQGVVNDRGGDVGSGSGSASGTGSGSGSTSGSASTSGSDAIDLTHPGDVLELVCDQAKALQDHLGDLELKEEPKPFQKKVKNLIDSLREIEEDATALGEEYETAHEDDEEEDEEGSGSGSGSGSGDDDSGSE